MYTGNPGRASISAADISAPDASEHGSGVLARVTARISESAETGVHPLKLFGSAHIDPSGDGFAPKTSEHGYVAVSASCADLPPPPTPTATPVPTPPPTNPQAAVGIDHDGGAPDINPGPLVAPNLEPFTLSVVSESAPGLVGVYDLEFLYDPDAFAVESCAPHFGGVCNANAGPGRVLMSFANLNGLPPTANLMDVTLVRVPWSPACKEFPINVTAAADTTGADLSVVVHHGQMCADDNAPPPPTPGQPEVLIGFDHSGPPLGIDNGPVVLPQGSSITLPVVLEASGPPVGAWQLVVTYYSWLMKPTACEVPSGSVCNISDGNVFLAGANVDGLPPTAVLGYVTFEAISSFGCGFIVPFMVLVSDIEGERLVYDTREGQICMEGRPPQPNPAPTPAGPPPFEPGGMTCLEDLESPERCDGDTSPGVSPDLRITTCVGWGPDCSDPPLGNLRPNLGLATLVHFVPSDFRFGSSVTNIGTLTGYMSSTPLVSLLNSPCGANINVAFSLMNASTDTTDTIEPGPAGTENSMAPLAVDVSPQNGIPDGADHYPAFLDDYVLGPEPQKRMFGVSRIQGGWIPMNLLVFAPGARVQTADGQDATYDPNLGHPVLVVWGDPTRGSEPGAITEFCSPLYSSMILLGRTMDNPCTPVSVSGANCPGAGGVRDNTGYPMLPCETGNKFDEDGDGVINDGCPRAAALAETGAACNNAVSDEVDGEDSDINDGCPAVGNLSEGLRMPGSCSGIDEAGCVQLTNPAAAGAYSFATFVGSLRDADGDGFDNDLDVCALQPNPGWNPWGADRASDPDGDEIPTECDPDSAVAGNLPPGGCAEGYSGHDQDGDCVPNRADNCATVNQLSNPQSQPGPANLPALKDLDYDRIGDACDPNPANPNGLNSAVCLTYALEIAGPGGAVSGTAQPESNCVSTPGGPVGSASIPPSPNPEAAASAPPAPAVANAPVNPAPAVLPATLPTMGGDNSDRGFERVLFGAIAVAGTACIAYGLRRRSRGRR
jgi:hypothetical protein